MRETFSSGFYRAAASSPCSVPVIEHMSEEMDCDDLLRLCNANKECQDACAHVFRMKNWNGRNMLWSCLMHKINKLLRNDDFAPGWWLWYAHDTEQEDLNVYMSYISKYKKDPSCPPRHLGTIATIILYTGVQMGTFHVGSPTKLQDYVNTFQDLFPLSVESLEGSMFRFEYDTLLQIQEFSTLFASTLGIHMQSESIAHNIVCIRFREVDMDIRNVRENVGRDNIVENPLGSIRSHDYFHDMETPKIVWIATTPINIRVLWSGPDPTRWCIQIKHPTLKRLVRRAFELKGCQWEETETASYVTLPNLKKDETPILFIINNFPFFFAINEKELYDSSYNTHMGKLSVTYDPDAQLGFNVKPGIHPSHIGNRRSARIGRAPKRFKPQ